MATFNGSHYIRQQIDSILTQLSPEDELIISDDSSTDNTIDIINSYGDPRIKLYHFKRDKKGIKPINLVTTNFENALKQANGDIIFLSDQDDVWHPDKVRILTEYLKSSDYVVSDCFVTDSDLNIISSTRFDGSITKNKYKALISPTPWQGSCAAFNRKVLNKALPFPKNLQSHDRWIGYIGSLFYNSKIIDIPLIYYRRHNSNTSSATTSKSSSSLKYKISTRLYYIANILKRLI